MFGRIKRFYRKHNSNPMNNRKKVGILFFATSIGLFFLFAGRFGYLVVSGNVAGTSLKAKTEALYKGSKVVKAKRGTIYDRNGVAIAEDATSYSVYAVLSKNYVSGKDKLYAEEKNFDKLADILVDVLKLDRKDVLQRLNNGIKEDKYQVEFGNTGKNISLEKKQAVEKAMKAEKIAGLYFDEHPARIYPNGVFASHLVGYADTVVKDGSEGLQGKMGIEAAYNDILSGKDGEIIFQKDNYQNPLPGTVAEQKASQDGQDIYTTLDSRLQVYLESLMDTVFDDYKPVNMTATLMEAKTGDVVAMSQRPSFNPESKEEFSDEKFEWMNIPVQDNFEPGSTMKAMTVAAGVQEGVFDENEKYQSGEIKVADATINDHDLGAKGTLTMRQALSWSSNVGMVRLEEKLGGDRWETYLKRFGFGQSTYSGLPGEGQGNLPTENIVDQAMSSFGQAMNVTGLQMLRAYTALANDGKMLQPQYIKKIVNTDTDKERVTEPEVVGNPITAETAAKVREYLKDTVEDPNYGTGYGYYKVDGYTLAAKTGTAQIYDTENGGYLKGITNYLYSVAEMIPAEDPEYILLVTIKQPERWTTQAIADIANPLLKRAMEFKNTDTVSTDGVTEKVTVADYRNLETTAAAADTTRSGLTPVVIGDGKKVKSQSTESGTKLMPAEKLILVTDSEIYYMPDVTGWSKADLMKLGKLLDIKVEFEGDGYAISQSIAPYDKIEGDAITFKLQ